MVYSIQIPCNATCYDKCPKDVNKKSNAGTHKNADSYQTKTISLQNC